MDSRKRPAPDPDADALGAQAPLAHAAHAHPHAQAHPHPLVAAKKRYVAHHHNGGSPDPASSSTDGAGSPAGHAGVPAANGHHVPPPAARHPVLAAAAAALEPDEDADPKSLESNIIVFQKKAIWLQMEEYRRLLDRAIEDNHAMQSNVEVAEAACASITAFVEAMHESLLRIAPPAGTLPQPSGSSELLNATSALLRQLNLVSTQSAASASSPGSAPPALAATSRFEANLRSRWSAISQLLSSLLSAVASSSRLEPDVEKVLVRTQSLSAEAAELRSQVAQQQGRIQSLEEKLESTGELLRIAEKRIDRLQMQQSAAPRSAAANGPAHDGAADGAAAKAAAAAQDPSAEAAAGSVVPEDKFIEATRLAEVRLAELQSLQKDRLALQHEINGLRIELEDARSAQARLAEMERQLRIEMAQHDGTRNELERLLAENQTLHAERRQFTEQVKTLEAKDRKVLEGEVKRLELDLQRIRTARDSLQKSLEERMARDELEVKQTQEMRVIAHSRKERIVSLENELQRLKMSIAASAGEPALMAFFEESPAGNPYRTLREQLESAKAQIRNLEQVIAGMESSDAVAQLSAQLQQQGVHEMELSRKLQEFERMLGDDADAAQRLASQARQIEELQTRCDFYQKTESRLLTEIETIGKAWAELEEQNSKRVLNFAEKEDHIMRLLAEKAKYEQKFAMLSKQTTTYTNMGIALRRQSDKQLEQIRKQEELEKTLTMQLQVLEKEAAAKAPQLEKERRRVVEAAQQMAQLKDKYDRASARCDQLSALVKSKTELAEQEAEAKRRVQEQLEVYKRKLEVITSRESPADSQLQKQLDEYKLLLKCQSCNNRFKSHALLKCMHTFCKECIDTMYNSRQRKCPSCGTAFGLQDIKPVYL